MNYQSFIWLLLVMQDDVTREMSLKKDLFGSPAEHRGNI